MVERVTLDRNPAGLGDQATDLGDGHFLGGVGTGLVVDLLVDDRAVEVVGAERARAIWAVLIPSITQYALMCGKLSSIKRLIAIVLRSITPEGLGISSIRELSGWNASGMNV